MLDGPQDSAIRSVEGFALRCTDGFLRSVRGTLTGATLPRRAGETGANRSSSPGEGLVGPGCFHPPRDRRRRRRRRSSPRIPGCQRRSGAPSLKHDDLPSNTDRRARDARDLARAETARGLVDPPPVSRLGRDSVGRFFLERSRPVLSALTASQRTNTSRPATKVSRDRQVGVHVVRVRVRGVSYLQSVLYRYCKTRFIEAKRFETPLASTLPSHRLAESAQGSARASPRVRAAQTVCGLARTRPGSTWAVGSPLGARSLGGRGRGRGRGREHPRSRTYVRVARGLETRRRYPGIR
jgi:hypothetical protein